MDDMIQRASGSHSTRSEAGGVQEDSLAWLSAVGLGVWRMTGKAGAKIERRDETSRLSLYF